MRKGVYTLTGAILAIATFFRLYRLPEFLTFLSDQGRDALVLLRLVNLEKLVFVGPTTSIGNVFTGPFYYYLIAPFFLLLGKTPEAAAYAVSMINSTLLVVLFILIRKRLTLAHALFFVIFAGLSATQIHESRYSWNPNPLPAFALLTLFAWNEAIKSKRPLYFMITGLLFGASLQLHYIAVALVPAFAVHSLMLEWQKRGDTKTRRTRYLAYIRYASLYSVSVLATFTPLILFEIKNKFVNTKTFIAALGLSEFKAAHTTYIQRLQDTIHAFIKHIVIIDIPQLVSIVLFLLIIATSLYIVYKSQKFQAIIMLCAVTVVANIMLLARLESGRHVHYFSPAYLTFYLLLSYIFSYALSSRRFMALKVVAVFFAITLYLWLQTNALSFLLRPRIDFSQVKQARYVAEYILSQAKSDEYQVVGLPFFETEGHFRFYLEYLGSHPMPADALGEPKELFVICHELAKPLCDIPGNPQWQLADFQNRHPNWRFDGVKLVGEVRVFKLVY